MKKEVKDVINELYEMVNRMEDCISLLQTAFIYNIPTPLNDCKLKTADFDIKKETSLTKKIEELIPDSPDLKPYLSVPRHLVKIGENIEKLLGLIERKIRENILFSDKTITEITFLLQRLIDILRSTADMILARNVFLSRYVQESEAGVVRRTIEYTTFHEERLIEGLSLSPSSYIYIKMMDAIRAIAWHSKEVVTQLT